MITASLVAGQTPQLVQLVVDEAPDGESWTITGTAGGRTWQVPGGAGVGTGEQIVLVDNRTPGNQPVTYTFTSESGSETSDPVTVVFRNDIVLQTLDGQYAADLHLEGGSLDVQLSPNVAAFQIPGRARPVVRYDVVNDIVSEFVLRVPFSQTQELRNVLAAGQPVVYRFGDTSYDLDPVGVIVVTSIKAEAYPTANLRFWTLGYTLLDDVWLDIALGAFTWDDFDAAMEGRTWDDFDALFSTLAWDAFDTTDWTAV